MKKVLFLLLTALVCVVLVACGGGEKADSAQEPAVDYVLEGTYAFANTHDGTDIVIIITLKSDGTYQKAVVKDDYISNIETGDYELVDTKVKLYDSESIVYHGEATVYTFEGGNLSGAGSIYKKISE